MDLNLRLGLFNIYLLTSVSLPGKSIVDNMILQNSEKTVSNLGEEQHKRSNTHTAILCYQYDACARCIHT